MTGSGCHGAESPAVHNCGRTKIALNQKTSPPELKISPHAVVGGDFEQIVCRGGYLGELS